MKKEYTREELQKENNELRVRLSQIEVEKRLLEQERNQYLNELLETRNSKTYKLARGITGVPRALREKTGGYSSLYGNQRVYPFMLSVVIAVYNTVDYLAEMLDSIIVQKQDVLATYLKQDKSSKYRECAYDGIYELILVDDGSDDGTETICDEYAAKYPWIKVLHKENGGVSSARNAGIQIATGKYITFPDSDDILTPNVFEDCFLFFEKHENDIAMVTYPLRFFEAQNGDHWTTYRFEKGTRIVDMLEEWDSPQYFTAASFFKTENIKGKIQFDSNLINGEDIKFAHEVMFQDVARVGLISTCTYMYRRRSAGVKSAIQQSKQTVKYYVPYVTDMLGWLERESEKVYGKTPKFVQYTIMGQLQWRLRSDSRGEEAKAVIGEEEYQRYVQLIKELLRRIDTDVILAQKQLFREHLYYACNVHTNGNVQPIFEAGNLNYYFENRKCTDLASTYVRLEFMEISDGLLKIEGKYADLANRDLWIQINDSKVTVENIFKYDHNVYILDEVAMGVKAFRVTIPLEKQKTLQTVTFGQTIDGQDIVRTNLRMGKFMPISNTFSMSYYANELWSVQAEKNILNIWNMLSADVLPNFEEEYEKQIRLCYGEAETGELLSTRREAISRMAWLKRNGYQLWLVSDRYSHADDNGEAFFRYLAEHKSDHIVVYFVIDSESQDFSRVKEIGNVVAQDSREHHILHLIADYIISSQADEYIINPFWRSDVGKDVFRDFYHKSKFIFLQHGVIKDDLSRWLNRYNKNIAGFICAAIPEAKSILDYHYEYAEENVWLTGLPRFDRLYHDERKEIIVMPTWRKWLMNDFNAAKSDKDAVSVIDNIEETEFFEFYSSLLNNKRLLDACDQYGYKLCYMPHTNFRECMGKFCHDSRIKQFDLSMPYREAFARANLLITDYSSTPMDFAYLRKPVIYAQFDKEHFFSGEHTYDKGYFEYERDGFGEVVYELDALIELIISYMQNDCQMKEMYKQRIDSFFAYHDQNNCERVYNKILQLTGAEQ